MQRKASAMWKGGLKDGKGTVSATSGVLSNTPYSFATRFENTPGTNPEELIAAAHSGCYSMALSHGLAQAGFVPRRVHTVAKVHLEKGEAGFGIPKIELVCNAEVPNITEAAFKAEAEKAKVNCPISKLLAAAKIELTATLKK